MPNVTTSVEDADLRVLGIETSCDETAAAVVAGDRRILAERLLSQLAEHQPYGGIVPEIAARAHLDHLDRLIEEAMAEAGLGFADLHGVAATGGPGLIGGLMVGMTMAKAIAAVHGLPLLAVNHLEGHALSARLTDGTAFPYLLLLVSGGHCQLVIVEAVGRYRRLGTTIDDAIGECFDKAAKMLGLGYPGGPAVERAAADGDAARFALPRPLKGRPGCDFSFSGLKTAVRHTIEALPPGRLSHQDVADLCASFQAAVADSLEDRCGNAIKIFRDRHPEANSLVVAGGVAANGYLRTRLSRLAKASGLDLVAPPQALCTDNAAMIAWAGIERLRAGLTDELDFAAKPRWPLGAAELES
ncbi:MAG: tRNA (adenosine(37)-N6)-threonylcarbamoyltransferase complex transferase subunit TsaD [Alphaproteobacteria bacterium]|nr:tRNA (adenosine(37)-N6)-threonylcarbamoyltransferase complex transferase subunit TsaD [Alphaproteobacteria bacterium]